MKTLISTILFLLILNCTNAQVDSINIKHDIDLFNKLNALQTQDKHYDISIPSNSTIKKGKEKGRIYYSNDSFVDGYIKIISMGNDDMDYRLGGQSQNPLKSEYPIKIVFYTDSLDQKGKKIRADKIIGFEKGNRYYSSEKTMQKPPFYIERIIHGYIDLFVFTYNVTSSMPMNNMTMYSINYNSDLFIKDKDGYLIKLNCKNIDNFIQTNFINYPDFIEKMLLKKDGLGKIFTEDPFVNNTCSSIVELIQLRNLLEEEN